MCQALCNSSSKINAYQIKRSRPNLAPHYAKKTSQDPRHRSGSLKAKMEKEYMSYFTELEASPRAQKSFMEMEV
jgi:hypothetical protein